ncbi:putative estradiol 17-beta-dehydrogenase protein [Rosellinia necatrix]|uniref:Putative estradiol 17-beta-dehydrogenase protein n=1 Tax=Rosellinia necatrix TaxID=77044 RepID=A0A1W2TKK4_ROSNE|nr:putative estradiol 17-beta-dehydrogenase protein [Rosellinia necatrix]
MTGNVWFIAGASSGFGKAIAEEALRRGDAVVASSRRGTTLKNLESLGAMLLDLDVTSDDATITAAFQRAIDKYGKITHFINAPGYLLEGPVEGASAKDALDSIGVNVLAIMNLSRLQIAYLRPRGSGFIANFGSVGSWYGGAAFSHYAAAKWAVSGFTESLHEEVKELGINATVIEPGYFRTGFLHAEGSNRKLVSNTLDAEYKGTGVERVRNALNSYNNNQPGDVVKGARVIVDVLTGSGVAAGKEFPIRLILGRDCMNDIRAKIARTEKLMSDWEDVIVSTDLDCD